MTPATWSRRSAACLFLATAALASIAARADGIVQRFVARPLDWREAPEVETPCRIDRLRGSRTRELRRDLEAFSFRQLVDIQTGELVWACISLKGRPQAVRQGDVHYIFGIWNAGQGRSVLVERRDGAMRALLAVGDKMFEARLSSETAISSFTIMDGRDGSTLVLDGSDRGEGVSAFPLSLHAQTVMTHWPGAEIYGESAKGFEAWPICDHRRLSIALERGSSSDVTCRRYDHDAWHEFTFERGGEHQSVLFVHGGPTLRFALDQRPYLLQLPLFGYRLRAVNYTDQDPPPEGEDGVRQADQAERQIVESWLSERRTSNTEPVVLVESFGFQLLGRLLARDEPLTIWAVSPIVSSQGWLALEKRRGAAEGIPWANWPRSESIVTSRRSPMAALCRRKSPTRLVIVAAARDPVIDPITASDLAKLKSCSHVDVEFISEDGDDHASGRLFADLFQREMDPNAGLPTLSLGAEM